MMKFPSTTTTPQQNSYGPLRVRPAWWGQTRLSIALHGFCPPFSSPEFFFDIMDWTQYVVIVLEEVVVDGCVDFIGHAQRKEASTKYVLIGYRLGEKKIRKREHNLRIII